MPRTDSRNATTDHGRYCVSPPLGEAIRVQAESGEANELSVKLIRRPADQASGHVTHRDAAGSDDIRLLIETTPGKVTVYFLDHNAAQQLIAGVQLAVAASA